jgi:aminoglycoside phosphotransferase (APT) family kinase protein
MTPPFDIAALEVWLASSIAGFRRPLGVRRFGDGQSNPTFLLTTPGSKYVLRKKPDGALLPSAHAVDREYHVMRALQDTGVPVPQMLGFCEDAEVVGTPFYVMAHVEGRIFWDPTLPELTRAERAALYDDVNRVIAKLHDVDYTAVGLGDYGRAGHGCGANVGGRAN